MSEEEEEEEEEKRIVISLITLGNSQVGKTQLTQVFVDDHFEMNTLTTIAYELKTKKVLLKNGHKIKVKIWDTAGQERFEKVALQYVVHAQGIYLVYDITDKNSFNQIEHWVELANQKVDVTKIPLMIVGNKTDLEDLRKVSFEEGKELANKLKADFYETSAKDNKNVKESFYKLINIAYEKVKNEIDDNEKEKNFKLNNKKKDNNLNNGGCCKKNKKK